MFAAVSAGAQTLSVDNSSLAEGDAGFTNFVFTVTLSSPLGTDVTMTYATQDESATAGSDYVAQAGIATIPAGATTTTVTVPVVGDTVFEPQETFAIVFTGGAGAPPFTDNHGVGTIVNDDPVPAATITDVSLVEGNAGTTNFIFTVTLTNPNAATVTIDFATADGTATAGVDYTAQAGSLTFIPGDVTETIAVPVAGDVTVEVDETFVVNLSNAVNSGLTDAQGQGTILNDDAAVVTADVGIAKTTTTTTFVQGQEVTYTLNVTNAGPGTASNLTVVDALPAGATFVSASGAGATCSGTTTVTCTIASLASGTSTAIVLVITATGDAPIANTATVTATTSDTDPADNTATAIITPAAAPPAAPAAIPTTSVWALLLIAGVLTFAALRRV